MPGRQSERTILTGVEMSSIRNIRETVPSSVCRGDGIMHEEHAWEHSTRTEFMAYTCKGANRKKGGQVKM